MIKAWNQEPERWKYLISIPVFGIGALTGSITLITNGQSNVIEFGLKKLV